MTTPNPMPMQCQPACRSLVLAAMLAAPCAIAWIPLDAAAQAPRLELICPIDADNVQPLSMGRAVLGALTCSACHSNGTSKQVDANYTPFVSASLIAQQVNDNWVRGDEWATWSGLDRHAQAYTTLLGERSKNIGKNLGVAEVHRDARCLACHSTLPAAILKRDGNVVDAANIPAGPAGVAAYLGVSCEACHGAAGNSGAADAEGKLSGWIDRHIAKQEWRYKTPADKQESGYYDVRTPSSRAAMCLSCHLGDARQGRLVTHAMYAAGHPPLPSFELKSFVDMMPAHWRELGDSVAAETKDTPRNQLPGEKPKSLTVEFLNSTADPFYRTLREQHPEFFARILENYDESCSGIRSMAIGVLTAWTKNADLVRSLMSPREYPLLASEGRWPELSQFECSACHHELRQADWRQDENAGAPGRPVLRDWAAPLCRAILMALAPDQAAEFDRRQREVEIAASAQPYGDRALLDERLEETAAWLAGIAKEIESRPFGRPESLAVLRAIAAAGAERPLDYDAARQLTWAFGKALADVDPANQWAAVRQQLDALQQRFVLDLTTTKVRQEQGTINVVGAGETPVVEIDLGKVLPPLANHSGREVREAFAQLAEALRGDPP